MKLFPGRQLYVEGKHRPTFRGVFHGIACILTLFAYYELMNINTCETHERCIVVYCLCHFLQFFISFVYHRFPHSYDVEVFLQKLDHSVIPLCIYGSWVPLINYTLEKERAVIMETIMGMGVICMATFVFVFHISKPYLHVAYSHLILYEMTTMSSRLTQEERMFMWGGTFLHIVSSIQFGLRKPFEDHKIFGFHTLNVTAAFIFYNFVKLLVSRDVHEPFLTC
jgi:channel protein (hemolysin III family)